jgi:uncharacterized protein with HEPN domain
VKLLSDILVAGTAIRRFTSGMAEPDYDTNELTRRAVERAFEIIGEALRRVAVEFPATLDRISSARQAISFRNVLTHGYDIVEDPIVWSIVVKRLPALLTEVQTLMDEEAART